MLGWVLLGVVFAAVSVETKSATVGYQLHSFNDLRQWPQLLQRGGQYFKVDPNWVADSTCEELGLTYGSGGTGCNPLVHDTLGNTTQAHYFDTLDTLLDFIVNPDYIGFFKEDQRKYISLCQRYALTCNATDETSQLVITTFNEFFQKAQEIVSTNNLNLEFVLDGSLTNTGRDCLKALWNPWVASWVPGRDPWEAAFTDSIERGYDSFQILNMEADKMPLRWLKEMQDVNYGKFLNVNYSYLIWEPSAQRTILEISSLYLEDTLHDPGFKFAINIDPSRFEVYSSPNSGIGWNYEVTSFPAESPRIALVPSNSHPGTTWILSVFFVDGSAFYVFNSTDGILKDVSTPKIQYSGTLLPVQLPSDKLSLSIVTADVIDSMPSLLLVDSVGNFFIFEVDDSLGSPELVEVSYGNLTTPRGLDVSEFTTCTIVTNQETYIAGLFSHISCRLAFQLWVLDESSTPNTLGSDSCISDSPAISSSLYGIYVEDDLEGSQCNPGTLSITLSTSSAIGDILFGYLCVDPLTGNVVDSLAPTPVTVGHNPQILQSSLNSRPFVFMAYDQAFCWNTERRNKDADVSLCDLEPSSSIDGPLGYSYGYLSDWIYHAKENIAFSVCSESIFHGTYDVGQKPSLALFQDTEEFGFAELHQGTGPVENEQCGAALFRKDQIILDSFTVYGPTIQGKP